MRTIANKTGITYDATQNTIVFAEDIDTIKEAIDDATTGINTQQIEINGNLFANSNGIIQNGTGVLSSKNKSKRGSDCSGNDGDINRILTLTNTKTTINVIVIKDGKILHEDEDYTVSHKSASSTITFLGKIANDTYIEVVMFS